MRALDINLVRSGPRSSLLALALAAVGSIALSGAVFDYLEVQDELRRATALQSQRPSRSNLKVDLSRPISVSTEEHQIIDRALKQLSSPWDKVLRELEAASKSSVGILDVEVLPKAGNLRLAGEAKDMSDVVDYVSRIQKAQSVSTAYLSHTEEKPTNGVKVIRFNIEVTWKDRVQ